MNPANASHSIKFDGLPLDAAQNLSDQIEYNVETDLLAISINEIDEINGLWQVQAYADSHEAAEVIARSVDHPSQITLMPEVDWVRRSLEGLPPVISGRFFIHGSHDREVKRIGGISLEIDAGTAFGTGHHGTTSGCLVAFDALAKSRQFKHILDLGCGTGVLGIAAARVAAVPVLATDIDPEAVRVTLLNAQRNGTRHLLRAATAAGLHHPAIRNSAPFDLIFANILARPLASLAFRLSQSLSPGGYIILSGITRDQQRWIRSTYVNCGLKAVRSLTKENWVTLVLRK
jgi:ribosomal protein L11 methyltransferase